MEIREVGADTTTEWVEGIVEQWVASGVFRPEEILVLGLRSDREGRLYAPVVLALLTF